MKISLPLVFSLFVILVCFASSSQAIKCIVCGPEGISGSTGTTDTTASMMNDKCKDPLPQAEECFVGAKECWKIKNGGEITRSCALINGAPTGCTKDGKCVYVCSSDACNSVSNLHSNTFITISIAIFTFVCSVFQVGYKNIL